MPSKKELLMEFCCSSRISNLSESATIAISTLASELKEKGRDILSFSAGEPDFDTPLPIKKAAQRALDSGFTKYTPVSGITELKVAIANKLKRENNLHYEPNQILVSNGAKQSLFNVFQALVDSGDEVIIPSPYWVTYPELVTYSGGKNVFLETSAQTQFKITPSQLANVITDKTKALILTTPSNPTGMVYSKQELTELAHVLKGSNIAVIADEIYEKLMYDGGFCSVGAVDSDMFARTITINGLSKSVAMTGWRIGYLASADTKLVKKMTNLQSQCTSNINSITQKAAIVALNGEVDSEIESMREAFARRRDLACEMINHIDGLEVLKPQGAFYLFINIQGALKNSALNDALKSNASKGGESLEFCKQALERTGLAFVPGSAFGMEGFIRMSFACSEEQIKRGLERLGDFIRTL